MKKRQHNQLIEKEKLIELYFNKNYSISMIVNEFDIPRSRIDKLFIEYGLSKKTMSEIQSLPLIRNKIEDTCIQKYGVKAGFADVEKNKKNKKRKIWG